MASPQPFVDGKTPMMASTTAGPQYFAGPQHFAGLQPLAGKQQIKPPMSKGWPIGLLVAWIVILGTGAALIGIGLSNYDGSPSTDDYETIMFAGVGVAAAGGLIKIAFWVVFTIFMKRRRRYRASFPAAYVYNQPGTFAPAAVPATGYVQQQYPTYTTTQPTGQVPELQATQFQWSQNIPQEVAGHTAHVELSSVQTSAVELPPQSRP